ncbi:MAG: hypothetical protein Q8830_03400 [Candidatus Phytoplasma australasiaticum]|nr:hypothetical protein [Candidatus Phytoplasma australasiaticum]
MMQQIAEMKRTQEPANLAITANLLRPDHERPPVHFSSPDPSDQPISISTNPPIVPVQASPIINLTTLDAGPSNIFSQKPHNAQVGSTSHIAHTIQRQTTSPESHLADQYNLPSTQTAPSIISFHAPIFSNPHIPQSTYPEVDLYQEKEKEWKAKEEMTKLGIKEEIAKAMK